MNILNLYCGIGGNRKLWGDTHNITAVELDKNIAKIYSDLFPNDSVIISDAHEYLENHFSEYDFIWSSPPCPTHSKIRKYLSVGTGQSKPIYPDMKLYEEIIFLQHYYKGYFVVENVMSYYEPLIKPQIIGKHFFWSNIDIQPIDKTSRKHRGKVDDLEERKGFDLSKYKGIDKRKVLRNCVEPELSLHIINHINQINKLAA